MKVISDSHSTIEVSCLTTGCRIANNVLVCFVGGF